MKKLATAFAIYGLMAFTNQAQAYYRHHHHHVHHHHYQIRDTITLAGQPAPLVAKIHEIESACGSRVISGFRRGARVAGSGRISNHARNHADDIAGNPSCIYAHLRGWPGGYSTDYSHVRHVHISYDRNHEWGVRFVHYSTHRYAMRHHHHYASN